MSLRGGGGGIIKRGGGGGGGIPKQYAYLSLHVCILGFRDIPPVHNDSSNPGVLKTTLIFLFSSLDWLELDISYLSNHCSGSFKQYSGTGVTTGVILTKRIAE